MRELRKTKKNVEECNMNFSCLIFVLNTFDISYDIQCESPMQNTTKLNLTYSNTKNKLQIVNVNFRAPNKPSYCKQNNAKICRKKWIMQKSRWDPVKLTQNKL